MHLLVCFLVFEFLTCCFGNYLLQVSIDESDSWLCVKRLQIVQDCCVWCGLLNVYGWILVYPLCTSVLMVTWITFGLQMQRSTNKLVDVTNY